MNMFSKKLGVKLKIMNLKFDGLIPGLQAKKFDIIDAGLSVTAERKKVVSFARPAQGSTFVLAARKNDTTPATFAAWNNPSKTITFLKDSTDEITANKDFPKAKKLPLPSETSALLDVVTGRADAMVVATSALSQFNKSNPGKLKQVPFKRPLRVEYGAWALQKGNTALLKQANRFLCQLQKSGKMARLFQHWFGFASPPMPSC